MIDVKRIPPLRDVMAVLATAMVLLTTLGASVYAAGKTGVSGKLYEVVKTGKYEIKPYAEVYEFYAHTDKADSNAIASGQTYNLGEKARVKKFDSFFR